jgi:PIN domain nuclease of toxin-antitoxin system
VNLLIDTHILFWWLVDDPLLPRTIRTRMIDSETRVFVSAATIWEMALKARLGKWSEAAPLIADIDALLRRESFLPLAITMGTPGSPDSSTGRIATRSTGCWWRRRKPKA